jgi:glycosyltransferase involved in cell wall biosynthesis
LRESPDVSILLPIYGESRFLDFAINSVVTQNFPAKWELIIVHRDSKETIKKIKRKYSNFDKHFVYLETKQGLTGALNEGLRLAKYGLIARLDSDDLMLENRIVTQVSAFMNDK